MFRRYRAARRAHSDLPLVGPHGEPTAAGSPPLRGRRRWCRHHRGI